MTDYTQKDYERECFGTFEVDNRQVDLVERLHQYYKDTPDDMSNRVAMAHWRSFKKWASERGYSQDEINRAKRICDTRRYQ